MESTSNKHMESYQQWKDKKYENFSKLKSKLKDGKNHSNRKWVTEVEEITKLSEKYNEFDINDVKSFKDFPLCNKTMIGLQKCGYSIPTAIQKASIFPALQGRDILGAAKTGSGKTLAFLIPVLECLFRERWSSFAGPGALIISPTRELAYQIFEVLKRVGKLHDFSAGLVIGGKDVKTEAMHMSRTNILVCTPGRLLQHMDQTNYFEMNDLQILVLDEADRILDMGFKSTINAVIENLPSQRQTLLFSATQTKSVKDLARLSLKNPAYISVHESSRHSTPSGLNQRYIVCKLEEKLNLLFSFIKNHLKTKTLIFLSSCKQVQFVYAAFCKMQPGVPLMMLHGNMKQLRRVEVYDTFCRKKFVTLFSTDVAARGLDFPGVDWVVQFDCPEDSETYIHRAGRTARYQGHGHAALFLLPSEEKEMIKELENKKVPISKTEISSRRLLNINPELESFCAENTEFKAKAQRSVYLMKNKSIFSLESLSLPQFAQSLGLAITPQVRFRRKPAKRSLKDAKRSHVKFDEVNSSSDEDSAKADENKKIEMFDAPGIDDDELFTVKRRNVEMTEDESNMESSIDLNAPQSKKKKKVAKTSIAQAKKILSKGYKVNQKIVYDDEGQIVEAWPPVDPSAKDSEDDGERVMDIEAAKEKMKQEDVKDKEKHKIRIKEKHRAERRKEKERRRQLQARREGRRYIKADNEEKVPMLENQEDNNSNDSELSDSEESDNSNINVDNKVVTSDIGDYFEKEDISLAEQEKLALHFLTS